MVYKITFEKFLFPSKVTCSQTSRIRIYTKYLVRRILLFTLNTKVNVFQVIEGGRVRGKNNGESRYKKFCKNFVVSGERERTWKTEVNGLVEGF